MPAISPRLEYGRSCEPDKILGLAMKIIAIKSRAARKSPANPQAAACQRRETEGTASPSLRPACSSAPRLSLRGYRIVVDPSDDLG